MIKNIHKLNLPPNLIAKLAAGAAMHHKMSNIRFKIKYVSNECVIIQAKQGRHMSQNYANAKTLVTRTRELFGEFVGNRKIHPHAIAYKPKLYNPQKGKNSCNDRGAG